ncbi:hypothetical protein LOZ53_001116 [Ophidiomyces ophidiicola]|uniref:Uncharacterized protein n=1 Tax=Ophidiomyces ophidiicola TaxID=1387563 RepID=A0ACB8URM0_9EURO|nr:hypothetical protein LOZ64_001547 [Ophidiomyces ophidiicola]KAI1949010.1 hypothetical protein LOZ62_002378 [Ophidiomyces ophidiicola]KAI1958709.1 hypothetical protein LOZ59_003393 [Ophidiomyces ophidiicola]KAI1970208.1 hypothetical protein LOZ56_003869 [Ophidiomyces ophidiicola]KAI1979297.1 hypothetical protein LOZ55_002123 [Ophidiomyces ophidiicola]
MFGALNRIIGRLDSEASNPPGGTTGDSAYGFQVLRNTDPDLPLEPWFDFIIGINSRAIVGNCRPFLKEAKLMFNHGQDNPDPHLFSTEVRNCAGSNVTLEVWSAKGQRTHSIHVPVPSEKPTLGLSLQLAPLSSTQHIWHVLSIPSPLSPAYVAGLLPHSDYILGTPSGTLKGDAALGELVEDHLNRSLTLWVYNSEFDVVREVEIVPNRNWGGEGALGAELGYGALHRLPVGLGEEIEGPGEVVFDTRQGGAHLAIQSPIPSSEGHFLVPAEMTSPPPLWTHTTTPSPQSVSGKHGRKPRHPHAAPASLDDYFREGEQQSKEQDFVPAQAGTSIPPPPKAAEPANGPLTSPDKEYAPIT